MKLDHEDRLKLSEFLESLATGKPLRPYEGICRNVRAAFGDGSRPNMEFERAIAQGICSGWEYFSGRDLYPVPAPIPEEFKNPAAPFWDVALEAERHYGRTIDHWRGEYGAKRRDLARYLSVAVLTWENEDEDDEDQDEEECEESFLGTD